MLSVARRVFAGEPIKVEPKARPATTTFYDRCRQNDPHFKRDLAKSVLHVQRIAQLLNERGVRTTVPETKVRPSEEQMRQYTDNGDLWAHPADGNPPLKIECKQRRLNFDSIADYPYPDIMVTVCHTHDRANPKPAYYVITDEDLKCVLVIPVKSTITTWHRSNKVYDRFKNRERNFYHAPLSAVITLDQMCAEIAQA